MATISRDQIEALASRLPGHGKRHDRYLAFERTDFRLAAKILRAMLEQGFPVGPLEIADDETDGETR